MADDRDMTIRTERAGDSIIVVPEGDIDLAHSPSLREALRQVLAAKPQRLVIDLSQVDYMDSSGVATLVEGLQIARRNTTKLLLCMMQDRVRSIFEIARLDTVFLILGTRDEALSA